MPRLRVVRTIAVPKARRRCWCAPTVRGLRVLRCGCEVAAVDLRSFSVQRLIDVGARRRPCVGAVPVRSAGLSEPGVELVAMAGDEMVSRSSSGVMRAERQRHLVQRTSISDGAAPSRLHRDAVDEVYGVEKP